MACKLDNLVWLEGLYFFSLQHFLSAWSNHSKETVVVRSGHGKMDTKRKTCIGVASHWGGQGCMKLDGATQLM